ncbi:Sau3AI family type II restriction endonuclease [Rhodoluna sp. KAS3]|uniref:Sau3AI family type II restriction endonuclease n=1 Tax=Rhodoluna sp. KAS3 TaxID=942880 RepID=UPI0022322306|nr:Sau3AI family type II restriction endonuclease [Rhodoluna sp. KAS3]BDS49650.1 DNA mismatch repair protein MutH [Rhodoluna sp. KAS3]
MTEKYDKASVESIVRFAELLTGKTLNEVVTLPREVVNAQNRGDLGGLVEAHFFELPPTTSNVDFPLAGLELKTTGLKKRADGTLQAKERLVLTMINYLAIVDEQWSTSVLFTKCRLMLILFYLYEKDISSIQQRFVLAPFLYRMELHDIAAIKRDWEFIQQKVRQGKAHELSEGDTFYLGACRKGPGGPGETLRRQPFSKIGAKSRAFSFKPAYVNGLIAHHVNAEPVLDLRNKTFEEATFEKFEAYLGKSVSELARIFDFYKSGANHKGYLRELAVRVLASGGSSIPELLRAGVEMKTIRLTKTGRPRESMSFPGFSFMGILDQAWEESNFFEKLESKFLFVVFQEGEDGQEVLSKVFYWNMPYEDRLEAKRVWEDTKKRVAIDAFDLPRITESPIAHVRPKARDGKDTLLTPQGKERVRQCFWLNAGYIQMIIGKRSS